MTLLGALCAGLCVFLVVAHLSGHGDDLRLRMPASRRRRGPSRAVWLSQAGVAVSPAQFRFACFFAGFVTLIFAWGLTGSLFVAAVPAVMAARMPAAYFGRRRAARLKQVVAAWPDGIRHLIATARARGTVHQGLLELARTGPQPLAEAFARYPALARMAGPVPALETIREDLADATSDPIIEVLIVAHERGQGLALTILRGLAATVTEDLRAREEIASAALGPKLNARITFAIPWFLLIALCAFSPAYRDFYAGPGGAIVVIVCAVMSLSGIAFVSRLARLPSERRVLGTAAGSAS